MAILTPDPCNIFDIKADALVNPVNCHGVMGKGLALQFKIKFPAAFYQYRSECMLGNLRPGTVQIIETLRETPKYIVNFPTKDDWRRPSHLNYIESGAKDLRAKILHHQIASIAVPPLGCGLGGLNWNDVFPILVKHLNNLGAKVFLIKPPKSSDNHKLHKTLSNAP